MIVYLVTNLVNRKTYVGITSLGLKKRWSEHLCAAKTSTKKPKFALHRAIAAYGQENFSVEVIGRSETWDELLMLERALILDHGSHTTASGYNLTLGGQGIVGLVRTKEHNQKISLAQKGRKKPPGYGEITRIRFTGRKQSPEEKQRRAASARGARRSDAAKARMSAAAIVRFQLKPMPPRSIESIEQGAAKQRGTKRSDVTRKKMSDSAKKVVWTDIRKAAASAQRKGRKSYVRTPEVIENYKLAWVRRKTNQVLSERKWQLEPSL